MSSFKDFNLSKDILDAIQAMGYNNPSEVQQKVIPQILKSEDIVVKSQTGTGKTAAFAIPLCEKINWENNKPEVLILTPTRELALQVKEDISSIGRLKRIKAAALFGKQPFTEQERELKQKTHIVVGTPGRVLDHICKITLDVDSIKYLVIDEVDEMLNMGFIDQVESIIKMLPTNRVTMLFSATISKEIEGLCTKYMKNPISIKINSKTIVADNIEHILYNINDDKKIDYLKDVLINETPETAIIFCRTKENVDRVFEELSFSGISVNKIHGGMLQIERLEVMDRFKKGNFRILVATDVASRGIDVSGITHVINFDIPMEKEAYIHRIGRTSRAGSKGKAITFVTDYENKFLEEIENYIGFKLEKKSNLTKALTDKNIETSIKILKSKPKEKKQKYSGVNKDITKIYLNGGKKKKIRPGDIVGAISTIEGIEAKDIGIIDVKDNVSYVDILNRKGNKVIKALQNMKIKGKKLKIERAKK